MILMWKRIEVWSEPECVLLFIYLCLSLFQLLDSQYFASLKL